MSTPTPAYAAITAQLRRDIAAGVYADGRQLPTEAELAEQHDVSRQTVRRDFHDLVAEGIVSRVPGRGTFVNDEARGRYLRTFGSIDDLLNLSRDTRMEVLQPLERRADIDAAGRLRLDTDLVHAMTFRRLHDDHPFVATTVFLPDRVAALLRDSPDLRAGRVGAYTVIGLLEPWLASPITRAEQSTTAVEAPPDAAHALGCTPGHPLLRIDRLYLDEEDQAVELAVSHFLPDRYTHRVTLRRAHRPR